MGAADDAGERVYPGGPTATRTADRLVRASPFVPNVARCAFTEVLLIALLLVPALASTRAGRASAGRGYARAADPG